MNLREQSYILAIAKYGSIKPAAEKLHISAPTLSIFLSNLEQDLEIKLFDRLGKQFVPTEAGKLYIKTAHAMMDLRNQYEAQMSDLKNEVTGSISFGIHPRRTLYLLPAALKEFVRLYPNVDITTCEENTDPTFSLLLRGELDFLITNQVKNHPSLTYVPLYQDHLVLVLPDPHPLAGQAAARPGMSVPWIDLALFRNERMILQQPEQTSRIFTNQALRYAHISPGHTFIISNLETAAQLAAEGLGIAFNFESYIRRFRYAKPIQYFYIGNPQDIITYYIVTRKDKYLPAYTQAFLSILKRNITV